MICTIPVMPKWEFSFNYIEGTAEGFNVRYYMTNCRQIDGVKEFGTTVFSEMINKLLTDGM